MAHGYHLVMVSPWRRIDLLEPLDPQVAAEIDRAAEMIPAEVPPDQVKPLKRHMQHRMLTQVAKARDEGGIDFYFTAEQHHGFSYNATFVVGGTTMSTSSDAEVGEVLADLVRGGAEAVQVGGTVWARREMLTTSRPGDILSEPVVARSVEYTTAVPGDPRRWLVVTFSCLGDGDPASQLVALVVELFDAMMSTWRWIND